MCWGSLSVILKPSKTQHSACAGQGTPSTLTALAGPRISKPRHLQGLCWLQESQCGLLSWAAGALHDCACVCRATLQAGLALRLTTSGTAQERGAQRQERRQQGRACAAQHLALLCGRFTGVGVGTRRRLMSSCRQDHSPALPFVCCWPALRNTDVPS